jgi:hypothetical protein
VGPVWGMGVFVSRGPGRRGCLPRAGSCIHRRHCPSQAAGLRQGEEVLRQHDPPGCKAAGPAGDAAVAARRRRGPQWAVESLGTLLYGVSELHRVVARLAPW